jgi:hypothetical protein
VTRARSRRIRGFRYRKIPTLTISLLLVFCQCHKHEPFIGHVSRSAYFEYHEHADTVLCPTLLSRLDEHARLIGGKLGLAGSLAEPFRYYHFIDASDFASQNDCASEWGACALGDAVYTTKAFDPHEQAHDYAYRAFGGWTTGLLSEGEAVALSCNPRLPVMQASSLAGVGDWRNLLYLYHDSLNGYYAAGVFVTYLAEKYGWQRVAALHRRVGPGISPHDFEVEFAQHYPLSMDDAWAAALSQPYGPPCLSDWVCSATPLAIGQPADPDCDGEMHRSIDTGGAPFVVLSFEGDPIDLVDCDSPSTPPLSLYGVGGHKTVHWAGIPNSRLALAYSMSAPVHVVLEQALTTSIVSDMCSAGPVVSLQADAISVLDLPAGVAEGWIRVDGGGRAFTISVEMCSSCGEGATCTSLSAANTAPSLAVGDGFAVRLHQAFALEPGGQIFFTVSSP